jgi:hypothetical protein
MFNSDDDISDENTSLITGLHANMNKMFSDKLLQACP